MLAIDDHRRLGRELDLFHLQDDAPGSVFWHPRGLVVLRALEEHVRRAVAADGYEEVRSPQVLARSVWEKSGHWEKFSAGMMRLDGDAALKPVSCPGHIALARRRSREALPLRLCEMGVVHRNERRSQLAGLFRLRQFMQDDGHVFCEEDQIDAEVARFWARARALYQGAGFDVIEASLSLRPDVRAGDDALWDRAELLLARALDAAGIAFDRVPGGGAFYGPKLELMLRDQGGRSWQCGTLQVDLVLPRRFGIRPPVILHRAMLGSFERFIALLLERHAGKLPPFLAPEAVRVLPVAPEQSAYAAEVAALLERGGARVHVDPRDHDLSRRVSDAHRAKVPIVVVVGPRDVASRRVSVREGRELREMDLAAAVDAIAARCRPALS